jgi:hypothetical protein
MSALRMRMIKDMTLSGLAAGTQATYIDAVHIDYELGNVRTKHEHA